MLFGVEHQRITRFQVHLYRAEFLGEVLAAALHQPRVMSIATCCPALRANEMLVPSPPPMFAIASFAASRSSEVSMHSPFIPSLS